MLVKSRMSMAIDTTWGNAVELEVEADLDNAHDLSIAELSRRQIHTLSVMVAEVRRENERDPSVRGDAGG